MSSETKIEIILDLQPDKITPGMKTGWQPEPEAQDLIGLAGIESD
jgi:hypothetical protein